LQLAVGAVAIGGSGVIQQSILAVVMGNQLTVEVGSIAVAVVTKRGAEAVFDLAG